MRNFFDEGCKAFEKGYRYEDCPLAPGSAEREEWEDGFREMLRALEENCPMHEDEFNGHPWHWEI